MLPYAPLGVLPTDDILPAGYFQGGAGGGVEILSNSQKLPAGNYYLGVSFGSSYRFGRRKFRQMFLVILPINFSRFQW